jgi:hypothetical protein
LGFQLTIRTKWGCQKCNHRQKIPEIKIPFPFLKLIQIEVAPELNLADDKAAHIQKIQKQALTLNSQTMHMGSSHSRIF